MARTTTNYGFNISEGSDLVNPLTDIFPNFEDIDTDLKSVSDDAIGTATELLTGTVHAITRADSDRDCIRFTATSNFTAGETFTVDGVQVTALTPDGQTLATGSYIIGSEVFAILKGTLLTVYVSPAKAKDSDLLDGHDSTYFAKESDMQTAQNDISTMSAKVGTGVFDTTAQDCVGAVNELSANLSGFLDNLPYTKMQTIAIDSTHDSVIITHPSEATFGALVISDRGNMIYVNKISGYSATKTDVVGASTWAYQTVSNTAIKFTAWAKVTVIMCTNYLNSVTIQQYKE